MNDTTKTALSTTETSASDNADSLKSTITDKLGDLKSTASEKLESAKTAVAGGFETSKTAVADKLHQAADSLSQRVGDSENADGAIAKYGQKAADILDRSADYVGDFDPNQLKKDLEKQVKNNPGRSLLIAGAVGLVLGALFGRSRRS